jgi:hypothetical protein
MLKKIERLSDSNREVFTEEFIAICDKLKETNSDIHTTQECVDYCESNGFIFEKEVYTRENTALPTYEWLLEIAQDLAKPPSYLQFRQKNAELWQYVDQNTAKAWEAMQKEINRVESTFMPREEAEQRIDRLEEENKGANQQIVELTEFRKELVIGLGVYLGTRFIQTYFDGYIQPFHSGGGRTLANDATFWNLVDRVSNRAFNGAPDQITNHVNTQLYVVGATEVLSSYIMLGSSYDEVNDFVSGFASGVSTSIGFTQGEAIGRVFGAIDWTANGITPTTQRHMLTKVSLSVSPLAVSVNTALLGKKALCSTLGVAAGVVLGGYSPVVKFLATPLIIGGVEGLSYLGNNGEEEVEVSRFTVLGWFAGTAVQGFGSIVVMRAGQATLAGLGLSGVVAVGGVTVLYVAYVYRNEIGEWFSYEDKPAGNESEATNGEREVVGNENKETKNENKNDEEEITTTTTTTTVEEIKYVSELQIEEGTDKKEKTSTTTTTVLETPEEIKDVSALQIREEADEKEKTSTTTTITTTRTTVSEATEEEKAKLALKIQEEASVINSGTEVPVQTATIEVQGRNVTIGEDFCTTSEKEDWMFLQGVGIDGITEIKKAKEERDARVDFENKIIECIKVRVPFVSNGIPGWWYNYPDQRDAAIEVLAKKYIEELQASSVSEKEFDEAINLTIKEFDFRSLKKYVADTYLKTVDEIKSELATSELVAGTVSGLVKATEETATKVAEEAKAKEEAEAKAKEEAEAKAKEEAEAKAKEEAEAKAKEEAEAKVKEEAEAKVKEEAEAKAKEEEETGGEISTTEGEATGNNAVSGEESIENKIKDEAAVVTEEGNSGWFSGWFSKSKDSSTEEEKDKSVPQTQVEEETVDEITDAADKGKDKDSAGGEISITEGETTGNKAASGEESIENKIEDEVATTTASETTEEEGESLLQAQVGEEETVDEVTDEADKGKDKDDAGGEISTAEGEVTGNKAASGEESIENKIKDEAAVVTEEGNSGWFSGWFSKSKDSSTEEEKDKSVPQTQVEEETVDEITDAADKGKDKDSAGGEISTTEGEVTGNKAAPVEESIEKKIEDEVATTTISEATEEVGKGGDKAVVEETSTTKGKDETMRSDVVLASMYSSTFNHEADKAGVGKTIITESEATGNKAASGEESIENKVEDKVATTTISEATKEEEKGEDKAVVEETSATKGKDETIRSDVVLASMYSSTFNLVGVYPVKEGDKEEDDTGDGEGDIDSRIEELPTGPATEEGGTAVVEREVDKDNVENKDKNEAPLVIDEESNKPLNIVLAVEQTKESSNEVCFSENLDSSFNQAQCEVPTLEERRGNVTNKGFFDEVCLLDDFDSLFKAQHEVCPLEKIDEVEEQVVGEAETGGLLGKIKGWWYGGE